MYLRRLYEINLRLFREELERMKADGREHCSDAVVIRMQRDRLETLLDSMPAPYSKDFSKSVVTVSIPDAARHPFSVYDEATNSPLGDNVVRFPRKRQISQMQRDLVGCLGCKINEFGDVFYEEVSEWAYPGDEYA